MDDKTDYPLHRIVKAWLNKIKLSKKDKKVKFQDDADECMKFFHNGRELGDLLWKQRGKSSPDGMIDGDVDEQIPAPKFRVTLSKAAELVQIFGPFIYHKNPSIVVDPKHPDIPMEIQVGLIPPEQLQAMQMQHDQQAQMAAMQAEQQGMEPPQIPPFDPAGLFPPQTVEQSKTKLVAYLLQYYLDYIQRENDKKTHARRMVDEALIKGASVLWTESFESYPGAPKQIGSFWETVDNLIGDPDADTVEEWTWCARKRVLPYWDWEERYNHKPGSLKKYAQKKSCNAEGEFSAKDSYEDDVQRGKTNDLIECWEVYSKTGMGHQLAGVEKEELAGMLDSLGRYCYLVVSEQVPFFLNIPEDAILEEATDPESKSEEADASPTELFMSVQWPIPFWADGSWPFTMLAFHEQPNCAWPVSHLSSGMGQLKALNWIITFMVNRLRVSMRTLVSYMKSAGPEFVTRLFSGKDFEGLPIENSQDAQGDISKVVHFLPVPEMKPDAWRIVELLSESFDKATGLTETAYAMQGGMRSAAEANVKQNALNVRPDDMANKMEDVMSLVARKEAMAARFMLTGESIMPVMGQLCAQYWEQFVMTSEVDAVVREFHYRVEAGSMRKPNTETMLANFNAFAQAWLPTLTQFQAVDAINAMLQDSAKLLNVEGKKYLISIPQQPQGPSPEEMEMQLRQQEAQQDMQLNQQKHDLKVQEMQGKQQMAQEKHQLDAQGQMIKLQIAEKQGQQKLQLEQAKGQQQMQMAAMKMRMDSDSQQQKLQGDAQASRIKMDVQRMEAAHKVQQSSAESAVKLKSQVAQNVAKLQSIKAQAKAKPKPSGGAKT